MFILDFAKLTLQVNSMTTIHNYFIFQPRNTVPPMDKHTRTANVQRLFRMEIGITAADSLITRMAEICLSTSRTRPAIPCQKPCSDDLRTARVIDIFIACRLCLDNIKLNLAANQIKMIPHFDSFHGYETSSSFRSQIFVLRLLTTCSTNASRAYFALYLRIHRGSHNSLAIPRSLQHLTRALERQPSVAVGIPSGEK